MSLVPVLALSNGSFPRPDVFKPAACRESVQARQETELLRPPLVSFRAVFALKFDGDLLSCKIRENNDDIRGIIVD